MQRSLSETLNRYIHVSRWLTRDLLGRFWRQAIAVLMVRLGGIGAFAVTLVIVTGYARLLEMDHTLDIFGRSYEARRSVELLILAGAGALAAMVVSAALTYLGNRWALMLRRDYQTYASRRVIDLAGRASRIWTPDSESESPQRFLHKLSFRDAKYCGRVAEQIVSSIIPPAMVLVVAVPILFFVHLWLTVLVGAIVAATLALHYALNVRAARMSLRRETLTGQISRMLKEMLQDRGDTDVTPPDDLDERFESRSMKDCLDAEVGFRMASPNSQLVSDVAAAVAIVLILVVFGRQILTEGHGWSLLLVYVVVMRYTMAQMRGFMAGLASSNRFYHQIRRYLLFVEWSGVETKPAASSPPPRELVLRAGAEAGVMEDSWPEVTVTAGQRMTLITKRSINRYALPRLFDDLLGGADDDTRESMFSHAAVVGAKTTVPNAMAWRAALRLPVNSGLEALRPGLEATGLLDPVLAAAGSVALPDADETMPNLDTGLYIALRLLSGAARGASPIIVDRRALKKVRREHRRAVLDQLGGTVVMLTASNPNAPGTYNEDVVAVVDETGVAGLGDVAWYLEHRYEAARRLAIDESTIEAGDDMADDDDEDVE